MDDSNINKQQDLWDMIKLWILEMIQYLWQLRVRTVGFSQLDTETLQDKTNVPALSGEANEIHQHLDSSEPMRHK